MYHFDDEGEFQEAWKHRVELVEPRADASAAIEPPENPTQFRMHFINKTTNLKKQPKC